MSLRAKRETGKQAFKSRDKVLALQTETRHSSLFRILNKNCITRISQRAFYNLLNLKDM